MTICIATDNDITVESGITTFNRHLMQLLQQAGHSVILLCVDDDAAEQTPDTYIQDKNVLRVVLKQSYKKIKNQYKGFYRPGSFDAPRWIATGLAFQEWLTAHAAKQNIDLVEVSDFGGVGIFLCKAGLPPVVITGHCTLIQYCRYNFCIRDMHYKVIERLEHLSLTYAQAVITHSTLNSNDLTTFSKAHVQQALIPWVNDTPETSSTPTGNHIAVVGDLQILKGAETACKALERLLQQGQHIIVHWFGRDTITSVMHGSVAQYLSKKYPLLWNQYFIWHHEQKHDQVLGEMQNALFVLVPSHWETFGYVALEAASLSKALIISEKVGAAELFENGKNAIIIPANDDVALAAALVDLYYAESKRQALGNAASSLVVQTFMQITIEERVTIYKNVIAHFTGHDPKTEGALSFLQKHHKPLRHLYFQLRSTAKKWLCRS